MAVGFPAKTTYGNGDVFSASDINDTNGTINLLTSAQFAAGKNRIINGDYRFNQRNFVSFNPVNTGQDQYNFDRFYTNTSGGTATVSPQTFTAGTAPVAGYEGTNFVRCVTTGQSSATDYFFIGQKMEDVRTFAGQTVTVSFWAKAATGTPTIGMNLQQNFGSGGSASVNTNLALKTISTSWARYSASVTLPSISGKTIGTSSFLNFQLFTSVGTTISGAGSPAVGLQNITADFWGVQVEQGSTATAFQTATGTIQGELAACQRYYFRMNGSGNYDPVGFGYSDSTTVGRMYVTTPPMRVLPTSMDYTNLSIVADAIYNSTAASIGAKSPNMVRVDLTGLSGLTAFRSYALILQNTANQYLGFSSEL